MGSPFVPAYGHGLYSLSDVVPSIMGGLGVGGMPSTIPTLAQNDVRKVCLLLIDGLGWPLLRDHPADAPFLSSLAGREITAGFPATTATSLTSIGTGLPAGQHGIVGYSFAASHDELINALSWGPHGTGKKADFRKQYVPEKFQPIPTAFERSTDAGVRVRLVSQYSQGGSGLTRAAFRGGEFDGVFGLGDIASKAIATMSMADRVFCYAYHGDLDFLGHVYGPGSLPWRYQLRHVDQLASAIAEGLPPNAMLVVTADHGMVHVGEDDRIDYDTTPELQDGVRLLGGEPRVRHVYTDVTADVRATWEGLLGERAWILSRDEAIEAGWFGGQISDHARSRIGDLVVATRDTTAIIQSKVEPRLSLLAGQHGSLTPDDQLIPLLIHKS